MILDVGTKHGYNIASALRGPDVEMGLVKYMFTAVIRYFAGVKKPHCQIVSPESARWFWENMLEYEKTEVRDFLKENTHFTDHISIAFWELLTVLDGPELQGLQEYLAWLADEGIQLW